MQMNRRLVCMVGLPRSGKTTYALTLGYPVVQPDAIRLAIHGHRFISLAEPLVWAIAKVMVRALFLAGHSTVVLDATNVSRKRRDEWKDASWEREFRVVDTSMDICLDRAGDDLEMHQVIYRMFRDWEPVGEDEGPVMLVSGVCVIA
jgi:predicted kinase